MLKAYQKEKGSPWYIDIPWGGSETCRFRIDRHVVRSVDGEEGSPNRLKDVYFGSFVGKPIPDGVQANALCCVKIINTDADQALMDKWADRRGSGAIPVPSVREQYDLYGYRGNHFRRILARNPDAAQAAGELRGSNYCSKLENCCIVEPMYVTLNGGDQDQGGSGASDFERMTVWERLEYVRQYIEALQELQSENNRIAGRLILAHRDVKVDNGLIERDYTGFRVVLVDMASMLFDNETDRVFDPEQPVEVMMGEGPHSTGKGILLSPANTPPELVIDSYAIGEKADVFALGGILASMFGCCARGSSMLGRNPIEEFHYAHRWPRANPSNRRSGSSNAFGQSREQYDEQGPITMAEFCRRYTENAAWDSSNGGRGESWLERDLERYGIRFCWGKAPGGTIDIPDDVLRKVRRLVHSCTRIDPADRLSLKEMARELEALMRLVPEERDYCNEKLYAAKEAVHLYDLACAGKKNLDYDLNSRKAAKLKRRAIRCDTYSVFGDGLYNWGKPAFENVFREPEALKQYVQDLKPSQRTPNESLTHALYQLCRYYTEHYYTTCFDGEIRIFTNRRFDSNAWLAEDKAENGLTCTQLLDVLEELTGKNVEVRVYCPTQPELPDERFRWEKTMSIGGSVVHEHKTQAPASGIEEAYVRGSECLYFLENGRKVFVIKKRR